MAVKTRSSLLHLLVLGVLLGLLACSESRTPASENADPVPLGRLPENVQPQHYRVHLGIDPREEHFSGETTIHVQLAESSDTIWLHGNRLEVSEVSATLADGELVSGRYQQVADIGVAKLTFPAPLPPGEASLFFQYTAPFNTSLEGLYKVSAGGEDYAFTQFQATSARLAFPGFDEPGFKVPFDISVEVDAEHVAVSSTPVLEENQLDNGNKLLRYQTTKPLPTYLLAFAVGPLDEVPGEPLPSTPLREEAIPFHAYAVEGKSEQLDFALNNTHDIVRAQEDYFGYRYPYEKLAVIAVPDFGAGAMENVGAITYREQFLLQSDDTPIALQQRFLLIHAHELAHQWFGNLVTPDWWDDIWLNEAFATWMATKTMQQLQPEAGYRQRMLNDALATMDVDRLESARQIRQPITTHAEIGAAFDGITYQKGGAVLAMLEGFVGEEAFNRGIQNYMRTHAFSTAGAQDFVQAIAAASERPDEQVEAAFFSFLEQPGTPVVDMDWDCHEDGSADLHVEQSRYLPLGSSGDPEQTWMLPLCVAYEQNGGRQEQCELVTEQQASFELETESCPGFVIPNADASGYYRWSLSPARWHALSGAELLNEHERLAAAKSLSGGFHTGDLNGRQYLDLLSMLLANSDDAQVAMAPLNDLYLMDQHMLSGEQTLAFRRLVADMYRPVYERIGLNRDLDDADDIRLRSRMLGLFAFLVKDDELRQDLHGRAVAYLGYGDSEGSEAADLDPNIREVALSTAVDMEGREFADFLLGVFHSSQSAVLREEILRALTQSNDPDFLSKLRSLALSEELRDNEVAHIVEPLMDNPETQDDTWTWLSKNLDAVVARAPSWSQGRIIEYADGFCDQARYEEIENEVSERIKRLQRGPRSLALTLEQIQLCTAVVEEQAPSVQAALGTR